FWAGLFLAVPMYFLGKRFGGWPIGFGAALLFQVLPVPVRSTVDTLSEGTYLLCAVCCLWCAIAGLDSKKILWLLVSGFWGGLAYLARPEGALLPLCLVGTMLWLRAQHRWEISWPRVWVAAAAVSMATLLVVAPYWLTIGRLSSKVTF